MPKFKIGDRVVAANQGTVDFINSYRDGHTEDSVFIIVESSRVPFIVGEGESLGSSPICAVDENSVSLAPLVSSLSFPFLEVKMMKGNYIIKNKNNIRCKLTRTQGMERRAFGTTLGEPKEWAAMWLVADEIEESWNV